MSSILVVLSNPISDEHDTEFNAWYNEVHIPEILSQPGFRSARRFKAVAKVPGEGPPSHRYLAIYGIDDVSDAMAVAGKATQFTMSASIDAEGALGAAFEEIFFMDQAGTAPR
jgi:hypothetical protein